MDAKLVLTAMWWVRCPHCSCPWDLPRRELPAKAAAMRLHKLKDSPPPPPHWRPGEPTAYRDRRRQWPRGAKRKADTPGCEKGQGSLGLEGRPAGAAMGSRPSVLRGSSELPFPLRGHSKAACSIRYQEQVI